MSYLNSTNTFLSEDEIDSFDEVIYVKQIDRLFKFLIKHLGKTKKKEELKIIPFVQAMNLPTEKPRWIAMFEIVFKNLPKKIIILAEYFPSKKDAMDAIDIEYKKIFENFESFKLSN